MLGLALCRESVNPKGPKGWALSVDLGLHLRFASLLPFQSLDSRRSLQERDVFPSVLLSHVPRFSTIICPSHSLIISKV